MSDHVFVVSEWLAKENCEQELLRQFKKLLSLTLEKEQGCLQAHVTQQIEHPGAPGKSKYKIVLHQQYENQEAFDLHCSSHYVATFFNTYIDNSETGLVSEWCCRLFTDYAESP